jgi:alpha-galactosidase
MENLGFVKQAGLEQWARPGHWNDPDMLEIGNGGMTDTEYQTHMSLWSILAAPLLAGNDLRDMPPSIAAILMNQEVIAIDQDKDGKQGRRVWNSGDEEIWLRDLAGGHKAVAVFNRGAGEAKVSARWSDLKVAAPKSGRDVWSHKDVTFQGPDLTATVPSHGVVLWVVR